MHTVWIVVGVVVVLFVLLLLIKSRACCCCAEMECCCDCGDCDCCTITSLPMFVIGVVALWGGGLVAVGWLVLSLVRS
jgi:hypothetical protein